MHIDKDQHHTAREHDIDVWKQQQLKPSSCSRAMKPWISLRRWGIAAATADFAPLMSSTGPLASTMKLYNWQLWRRESPQSSRLIVIDPKNETKPEPPDAAKSVFEVADAVVRTLSARLCIAGNQRNLVQRH